MADNAKRMMGRLFAAMFMLVAMVLVVTAGIEFVRTFHNAHGQELISGIVRAINTAVISLATFELGLGIGKEYTVREETHGLYPVVRRTVTRFVSVVCIALVLEGLIMVIKYSQLELAGNLYYPVAIIIATSILLMGLGVFIHLTRGDALPVAEEAHEQEPAREPTPDEEQPEDPLPAAARAARYPAGHLAGLRRAVTGRTRRSIVRPARETTGARGGVD